LPQGRIIKDYCGYYLVDSGQGVFRCRLRGSLKQPLLTGDEVVFVETGSGEGRIEKAQPRRMRLRKPPVANVDGVLIVSAVMEPALNLQILDRYLACLDLETWLLFNKTDLGSPEPWISLYASLGYRSFSLVASLGRGIEELKTSLRGRTWVLVGQSGAGKSTLINALCGAWLQKEQAMSQKIKRGKQTTRFVQMFPVAADTYLVDTPGFTFAQLPACAEDLQMTFPELRSRFGQCRFNNCLHRNEPGCIIRDAVQKGLITQSRYDSYSLFLSEVEHDDNARR
jgi:ribosome biogenesis GTPase